MFKNLCLIIVLMVGSHLPALSQSEETTGGYQLVWADEFDKKGAPDTANWNFEHGLVRNHELQWYQPDNATCKKGKLIIEARRANFPNPNYNPESKDWRAAPETINYTSSSLNTRGLHSWKYGRFVMRGKIDTDPGLWPAFWTLGVNGEWPSNGEIDIMEYYRNMLLANIATGTSTAYQPKWFSQKKELSTFNDPDWSKKFHVWRMDWDSTEISLYVDDELLNRVALKELVNNDGTQINPFDQPHYILLNLSVGGDNGGDPSSTKFPKKFEVDYVRVYQKQ
ncbi:glycoside hydrolase family 16 protein [Mucilaginibacter terrenus]|uniref:Glycoside hydrolase family 16 protein n=2 Tax=Mucilaginibacter terrenus TaxID=2482727 RepID=A0A3E2NRB3_9SPHI|nr:glycoside hydrolase family 16 protein [Mucilaginibacter terrenus]